MTTFTIDGRLPGLNEVTLANRTHHHAGAKVKRSAEDLIGWCIKQQRVKPVEGAAHVSIIWHEATKRRDPDNVFSAVKFILDAMVTAGVIQNDSQQYIKSISHVLAHDKDNPRIVVHLEEAK